jgi:RNA polymerase sigma-70 factor (ECF subfamily)
VRFAGRQGSLLFAGLLVAQSDDADQFLVTAVRKGDQRAWQQLIDRYQGRLLAFAQGRLRKGGEAEDVVQDTFMGFVTSLPNYDVSRPLETYLFAILRYKIGEALTRMQRRPDLTSAFDIDDARAADDSGSPETPSGIVAAVEGHRRQVEVLSRILRRLIEELRDRGKLEDLQVIELLFYVGLRNKEAAERLGRDEKAVAGVKFRALASLRGYLDELEADDRAQLDAEEFSRDATIASVWRSGRLTCLKRSTIGSYLLGVLEEPWTSYTAFHLDQVRCLMCRSNLEDLSREDAAAPPESFTHKVFQSSAGFLSRPG